MVTEDGTVWETFPLTKFIYVLLGLFNNICSQNQLVRQKFFMVHLVYLRSHLDPGDIEMSK